MKITALIVFAALAGVSAASRPGSAAKKPVIAVQPLASGDFLELSVRNEVDHAISRAGEKGAAQSGAGVPFKTNGMTRTAIALKLVSAQKGDGRWLDGTNDYTAAAVKILEKL